MEGHLVQDTISSTKNFPKSRAPSRRKFRRNSRESTRIQTFASSVNVRCCLSRILQRTDNESLHFHGVRLYRWLSIFVRYAYRRHPPEVVNRKFHLISSYDLSSLSRRIYTSFLGPRYKSVVRRCQKYTARCWLFTRNNRNRNERLESKAARGIERIYFLTVCENEFTEATSISL